MPTLTVEGFPTAEVDHGKRLVLAIEQDVGVDILHACGGNARCTTCRVEFLSGEPEQMTQAEKAPTRRGGMSGVRLSCQIVADHDMTVRAITASRAVDVRTPVEHPNRRFSRRRSGPAMI